VLVHPARECVTRAFHDLEQGQIDVGRPLTIHPLAATALQDLLEVAEELRHAALAKGRSALRGFRLLILVILAHADGVVRVVHFREQVRDRQLQLVRPQPAGFVLGREPVVLADEQQDVGSLCDDELTGFEIRRGERNRAWMYSIERVVERLFATAFVFGQARHVHVRHCCVLERETGELAPPRNRRPVMQLVLAAGRCDHGRLLRRLRAACERAAVDYVPSAAISRRCQRFFS
jgi:hypothetical protein